jgi:hypothetical protein
MRKFKGGGSSGPTETTVTQTDLPEYVQPYFERLLKRSEADSIQGYQPYGGQRLAYFSPDELTSQAMTRGYATSGTPQAYRDAQARFGSVAPTTSGYTAGQTKSTYDPREVGPTYQAGTYSPSYQAGPIDARYDPNLRESQYIAGQAGPIYDPLAYEQNLSRFMSPYQQNVIDVEKREARRQSELMGKQYGDAATMSGGLGGYREGIVQAERERNLGQQLGDIQQRGSQAAFESAQQQLERERAMGMGAAQYGLQRYGALEQAGQTQEQLAQSAYQASEAARQAQGAQELQSYQAGESARQEAARLGLSAEQIEQAGRQAQEKFMQSAYDLSSRYNIGAAEGLMQSGQAIQQDAISRMGMLGDIGRQQRALRQAGLDLGYEDYLRQRDWTKSQLGGFGGILRGVPATPQQTISTYQQQPGLFQTALGAGLSGLGLYKGLGG